MRSRLSSRTCCLASIWRSAARCCSEQPPQMPYTAQRGSTRSGEGSSTASSRASSKFFRRRSRRKRTRSPARAPSTNTFLPGTSAMPRPSWVMPRMPASSGSRCFFAMSQASAPVGAIPGLEELREVRLPALAEGPSHPLVFLLEIGRRHAAAHELEAQIDQVGVDDVRLAVIAYARDVARLPRAPDLVAAHAELAGESEHHGNVVQARPGARLVTGQHVHQVDVAPVEAAQVVVVAVVALGVAGLPVTRRHH